MTRTQINVLKALMDGGFITAALREPEDFSRDGIIFSETVGVYLHRPGKSTRTLRGKTLEALYPRYVNHCEGASGIREFRITPVGREIFQPRA